MDSSFWPKCSSMPNTPKPSRFLIIILSACFTTTDKSANDEMEMEIAKDG